MVTIGAELISFLQLRTEQRMAFFGFSSFMLHNLRLVLYSSPEDFDLSVRRKAGWCRGKPTIVLLD